VTNKVVAFRSIATVPNELKQRAHVPVTGKKLIGISAIRLRH